MSQRLRGFLAFIAAALMVSGSGLILNSAEATGGTTPIEAKALTDHECNSTEWHFVITQVEPESNAPSSIMVNWANGDSESVPLDKFTGKTAHYATTSNLDSTVTSATTNIYQGWTGQFNLSHGPCGGEEPPPTTVTPDKPSATQPNCDNPNMTVTPGDKQGIIWNPSGSTVLKPGESVTYVATPAEDYEIPKDAQTSWTFTNDFEPETCGEETIPVSPTEPTPLDECEPATGPTNDRINGLSDANFTYRVDGVDVTVSSFVATGTSHTVKAIAKEGVVIKEGAKTEWTYQFTKVKCVTTTPTPTSTPTPTPTVTPTPTPTPTPTVPTSTPTTPTGTPTTTPTNPPTKHPTPTVGTPTSTSIPTPTSTPTFVPPSTGGGEWPPSSFGSSDYSLASMMGKLMVLVGFALMLAVFLAPRRRKVTMI